MLKKVGVQLQLSFLAATVALVFAGSSYAHCGKLHLAQLSEEHLGQEVVRLNVPEDLWALEAVQEPPLVATKETIGAWNELKDELEQSHPSEDQRELKVLIEALMRH